MKFHFETSIKLKIELPDPISEQNYFRNKGFFLNH